MSDNLLKKALHKHKLRQYGEARGLYLKILQKNPRHLDANYLLGTLWAESGDLARAEQYLLRAASIEPRSPMIQTNLGNVYKLQDKLEEAEQCFLAAIRLKSDLAAAHFGLGHVWELTGKEEPAKILDCYKQAVAHDRNLAEAHQRIGRLLAVDGNVTALDYYAQAERLNPNLQGLAREFGVACVRFGRCGEAKPRLMAALRLEPDNPQLKYFLCIAEGREPDAALKLQYVAGEFDSFSPTFDQQLVEKLGYRGPEILRDAITEACGAKARFQNAADIGCGTGLVGLHLKTIVSHLTGIDLSERMLDLAAKRQCYDDLLPGDIRVVLGTLERRFDLFTAGDVTIYIGPLEELFAAVAASAAPGAVFALFTERHDGPEDFVLRQTGRYAHNPAYLRALAEKTGFAVELEKPADIRKEYADWVPGDVFVLRQGGTKKVKTAKTAKGTQEPTAAKGAVKKSPGNEKATKTKTAALPKAAKAPKAAQEPKTGQAPKRASTPKTAQTTKSADKPKAPKTGRKKADD